MKKILLSSMMLMVAIFAANAQQNKCDVNGDGHVTSADITEIYNYLLNGPEEPTENAGIFICNEAGWESVALYAWPQNDILPDWPGVVATGTVEKYGKTYSKFDLNNNYFGTELNFIANNNDGGQQVDLMTTTLGDEPIYVTVYINSVGALSYRIDDGTDPGDDPQPEMGYTMYVHSDLDWEEYAMYVWSNSAGGNVEAGWPGIRPAETTTINGEEWLVFKMTTTYSNYNDTNWIINNNGGGSQFDLMSNYDFQADAYVRVAADGTYTISASPAN